MEEKGYELPEDVKQDFQKILGFKEDKPVPAGVVMAYKFYQHKKDVCGAGRVTTSELILLVMLAGYPKE